MEVTPLSFGVRGWTFGPSLDTMIPVFYWKDHFFIYNNRLLFVIGLVFSRSLTRNAFVSILTWYFASNGDDVVKSAILSNAFDLISSIFVIFMAYLADSFIGRFQTLLFSNIAYIGALVLFYMFHPYDVTWLLVISLVLLALGTSGDQILEDVLQDLVNDIDKSPDREETRSIARATIWSRVTNMSAAVLSTLLWAIPHATSGLDSSWKSAFVICIIPMILAVIVSGFGHNVYHQGELTEIQLDILGCLKIFSRHKRSPKNMDIEKGETEGIKQEITLHLEDKVVLKSLLEMLPMWLAFSVVSIISAAGNTFFLQQYSNLDTDNDIAVQLYTLVQEFSSFAIAFLYRWICCLPKNEKVKIGVGMLCGLVSCICAWQLEVYRLKEVSYLVDEEHTYTSISFLWLVPQFCLVGCMKGLTEEGLLEFYNSQMKKEHYLQRYREEYTLLENMVFVM